MKKDVGMGLLVICLACTLPYMYNLVHAVLALLSLHPSTCFENVFNTCIYRFDMRQVLGDFGKL